VFKIIPLWIKAATASILQSTPNKQSEQSGIFKRSTNIDIHIVFGIYSNQASHDDKAVFILCRKVSGFWVKDNSNPSPFDNSRSTCAPALKTSSAVV
jgi:hypothetical protein